MIPKIALPLTMAISGIVVTFLAIRTMFIIYQVKRSNNDPIVIKTLSLLIFLLIPVNWMLEKTEDPVLLLALFLLFGLICHLTIKELKPVIKKD